MDEHIHKTLAMIGLISPEIARDIGSTLDSSLVEYARLFYQPRSRSRSRSALVDFYRDKLANKLTLRMRELGQELRSGGVRDALDAFPVIQTAPHCQLYLDAMAFWAYLLGWIGAFEAGCPLMPVFNTATVTFQSKASSGPAWLTTTGGALNIINLPSSKLAGTSVYAVGTDVAFDRAKMAIAWQKAGPEERPGLEKVERSLATTGSSFADLTDRTNINLLEGLSTADIHPVLFSEALVRDMMVELLTDGDPLIGAVLFDPRRQAKLAAAFARARTQPYSHFLSHTTTHFWGIRERKIRKLEWIEGWLVESERRSPDAVRVRFEPSAVIDALRSGTIVPNLFWSFVVVAILPHLAAIGGTRQIGYLKGFIDIFRQALEPSIPEEAQLLESFEDTRFCFWGAKVIENMPSPLAVLSQLPSGEELNELHRQCQSLTVREATKNLAIFFDHQRWKHLYQ